MPTQSNFSYRGCQFACETCLTDAQTFEARVHYLGGLQGLGGFELPQDAGGYGTEAEAMRHAEQQAMRWVNDRTGDGQGQF